MKNLILILLLLNISCKGNGQEIKQTKLINYDETIRKFTDNDFKENKKNIKTYRNYLTLKKDTVLVYIEEYEKNNLKKDTVILKSNKVKNVLSISNFTFLIGKSGMFFLIKKDSSNYNLKGKIIVEYETFYDNFGEANQTYFPAGKIQHYKNKDYIVTYFNEGEFKIGIFEITEKGITKKFLSKGCLIYDEWSEFSFYEIKGGKVFVNYLIDPEGEETGQIELKHENGEYSLDKDQCRE